MADLESKLEVNNFSFYDGDSVGILRKNEHSSKNKAKRLGVGFWLFGLLMLIGWIAAIVFIILWYGETHRLELPPPFISDSFELKTKHAAVVADDGVCSEIGRDMLRKNGTAVDAIIATSLCNSLKNMHSISIGGGFFMTIFDPAGNNCTFINARETAPAQSATPEATNFFNNVSDQYKLGWKAIGVPGEIAGYWEAHRLFGNLPWKDLFAPAIDMAHNGWYINRPNSIAIKRLSNIGKLEILKKNLPDLINPNTNELYKEGELFKARLLADTFRKIANTDDPIALFYGGGELARIFAKEFKEHGAYITMSDLKSYKVKVDKGFQVVTKSGLKICTGNPPSAGAGIAFAMELAEEINIAQYEVDKSVEQEINFYHYLNEVLKHSYAMWSHFTDRNPNIDKVLRDISDPKYVKATADRITDTAMPRSYYLKDHYQPDIAGTAHMSAIDTTGFGVSLTSTMNYYFGSMRMSNYTGIIWNNQMLDFSLDGKDALNKIENGKRPRSAMSPIIVIDSNTSKVKLITGASGAKKILAAVAQVAIRSLYMNQTIKQATDAARIYPNLDENHYTSIDKNLQSFVIQGLRDRGNSVNDYKFRMSVANSILVGNDYIHSSTDYRKPSFAAGY